VAGGQRQVDDAGDGAKNETGGYQNNDGRNAQQSGNPLAGQTGCHDDQQERGDMHRAILAAVFTLRNRF